jgi:hypothetical protein
MPDLETLFDQLKSFRQQPLDKWHPEKSTKIDIRIDRRGKWYYLGTTIDRIPICKLFSTLLRFENDTYYLVTPPVKYQIVVDEAPFIAVELNPQGSQHDQCLYFRTNMDDVVLASAENPLTIHFSPHSGEPSPYLEVRDGLKAKLSRPVYYQLAELTVECASSPDCQYMVISDGTEFCMG